MLKNDYNNKSKGVFIALKYNFLPPSHDAPLKFHHRCTYAVLTTMMDDILHFLV